jgi:hypothetical protein
MAGLQKRLDKKSSAILAMIARGYRYEQILSSDPELTYVDIFDAAREALEILSHNGGSVSTYADVRSKHPRAYQKWEPDEDARLAQLVQSGRSVQAIADLLQRQPSAIRSRMDKLGLHLATASTAERKRHSVMEFYGRGQASWDGTDAQDYVNRLRAEWDHRP